MNEFTNMYSYLKVISQTNNRSTGTNSITDVPSAVANETGNEKEDYCRPRPLSETYSVPPIARPLTTLIPILQTTTIASTSTNNTLAANYSIVPTPTPVMLPSTPTTVISNGLDLSFQGYMKMHPAGSKMLSTSTTNSSQSRTGTPTQGARQECYQNLSGTRDEHRENCGQKICQNFSYNRTSSNSSTKSREPSGPQDELLEIINDFKNNVFTISEVERLVENWQKRNDVQQSFKDKQRQLTAMREEYDRIQKKMKEEMKTPTPFDKIRRFFSKGKKDTKESVNTVVESSLSKSESINSGLADRRPVSSLSLRSVSSSSSSGRMSTVSGCSGTSLGDSGTHSDSEDRRLQNVKDGKTGITSYEIPPPPKPFTGRYSPASGYSPSPTISIARDLDLQQSPSRVGDNEYYIAFPPSGLPIHAFKADGSPKEPATPNSPCEHSRYLDFIQNVSSDKNQEETAATKYIDNNSYTNIDPSMSNFTPLVAPSGMCIPNCTNSETVNSVRVDCEIAIKEHHGNDIAEICSDMTKVKPIVIDEVDFALTIRGQETIEMKYDIDSINISKNTNEITETRMPEYMNLTVNMGHETVLGAIPKKLPAPPVPPRGSTKK